MGNKKKHKAKNGSGINTNQDHITMGKDNNLEKKVYEAELVKLQIELVKLQEWIKHEGLKGCCYI